MSDSLWLHGLQHTRLPCPSLSPRVCSNSCPLSWWCHPTISSSAAPFSPALSQHQVFYIESALPIRWPKYWSFSFSISPSNEYQGWFPLGLMLLSYNLWKFYHPFISTLSPLIISVNPFLWNAYYVARTLLDMGNLRMSITNMVSSPTSFGIEWGAQFISGWLRDIHWWMNTHTHKKQQKKDVLFIIGDWNAKLGSQEIPGVTGKSGLRAQNETWQRLIEFCQENALVIANTLFQQHNRRLYT